MKFCRHCGKELIDDAVICPACGCAATKEESTPQDKGLSAAKQYYTPMSIIGFVFAFVFAIAGAIISFIALGEAKSTGNDKAKTLAKAGLTISLVIIGLGVLAVIAYFTIFLIVLFAVIGSGMV